MKLLFVIDHLGPAGAQHQLITLGTSLKARGHSVEFFIYYPHIDHFGTTLKSAEIPLHISTKRATYDIRPPLELRRVITTGKFDVSISFLTTPNIYNVLAALKTSTKTVVSERSTFPFERVPLPTRLRFGMHRLADHIVVNSRHHHERLCREFPWMESNSSCITNGVDLVRFSPTKQTFDPGPEGLGSILAVGSIHAGKNFAGLIDALHHYQTVYGEPPRISWAGREPIQPSDVAVYEKAKIAIRRYGLEDSWEWLGVRSDIPELLNQHDAFIHPSLFEGLPNVVCEALAAGKPVLASNVCDHPWLVEEGNRGFLFDPLDPADIARAIRRFVLLTFEEKCSMARNARAFAERTLSVDVFVDAFEALLVSMQ